MGENNGILFWDTNNGPPGNPFAIPSPLSLQRLITPMVAMMIAKGIMCSNSGIFRW